MQGVGLQGEADAAVPGAGVAGVEEAGVEAVGAPRQERLIAGSKLASINLAVAEDFGDLTLPLSAQVVVEKHRHEGVFIARGKEDALVTKNMVPGESVYGEKRIASEVRFSSRECYRGRWPASLFGQTLLSSNIGASPGPAAVAWRAVSASAAAQGMAPPRPDE